jgi:solute carrier family 25 oxoglutarate transporter 11
MLSSDQFLQNIVPFGIGGVSGAFATLVIQPIDTLKVLVQVISEKMGRTKTKAVTIFNIVSKIKLEYGLSSLYRGLDSALFRQLFYASARVGAYDGLMLALKNKKQRKANTVEIAVISLVSGAFGAFIGNPFEVALIRKQASL